MLKAINAVIFDMDGVIFDSEKVYYQAFFMAADKHEVEATNDFVHRFAGKTAEDCQHILYNYFNRDFEKTRLFFRDWAESRLDILSERGLEFKEGFLNLFDNIRQSGRPVGLVTSAHRADMEENFSRNNSRLLSEFEHIITIEDVKKPKPHPQPYQRMMDRLEQKPEHCIVIEDSISGVRAGVQSGAKTIMINENILPPEEIGEKLLLHTDHHDNILMFLKENGL
ncbi:MAG: hypothetical protein CSA44_02005 [Gammaproteobacteria bacterium]|nr:MAG: hypothetical protein CSA44_02005 [Gammaproteobacteria bacterium]